MELITAKEVAEIIKASEWFVYQNRSFFGGIKIKGVVRFEKSIVEGVINDTLETSRQMALRLHEERGAIHKERILDKTGSQGSGSGSRKTNRKDKYGLLETLH